MKNTYYKRLLEIAYRQFQLLKEDEDYKFQWDSLEELKNKCRKSSDDERFKYLLLFNDLSFKIKEKWFLTQPISPYLKLKKEDLFKVVRPNSALAKFIYAFGVDTNPALVTKQKTIRTVSKVTQGRDLRKKKILCYLLLKKLRFSDRELARLLHVDKKTVKNWIREVKNWPVGEQNAVTNEILMRKHFANKDILVLPNQLKTSVSDIEHILTSNGIFKTGRKLKHKPSN